MLTDREAWATYINMLEQISELENKTALNYYAMDFPTDVLNLISDLAHAASRLNNYMAHVLRSQNPAERTIYFGNPHSRKLNNRHLNSEQTIDKNGCVLPKGQS